MQTAPQFVYKIVPRANLVSARSSGMFLGMPIDASDGYIHLSTAQQLGQTLSLHFAGQTDLLLLALPTHDLGAALKWEISRGGALFPHFYGPLPLALVAWEAPITVAANGECHLPEKVQ